MGSKSTAGLFSKWGRKYGVIWLKRFSTGSLSVLKKSSSCVHYPLYVVFCVYYVLTKR